MLRGVYSKFIAVCQPTCRVVVRKALLIVLAVSFMYGCDEASPPPASIASVNSEGKASLLVAEEFQLGLSRRLASRLNPDVEIGSPQEAPSLEQIGPNYFLVTRFTTPEGECLTTAVRLDESKGGKLGALENGALKDKPGGDTCHGQNCSGRDLRLDDEIRYYCECFRAGGGEGNSWCNHSGGR